MFHLFLRYTFYFQIQVASIRKWNLKQPTIGILLTALYVGWRDVSFSNPTGSGIFVVPYSNHSSYTELMDMVSKLAPRQVKPIVCQRSKLGPSSSALPDQSLREDMSVYSHLLTSPPPEPFEVPEPVAKMMNSGAPLWHQQRKLAPHKLVSCRPRCTKGVLFTSLEDYTPSPYREVPVSAAAAGVTQNMSMSGTNNVQCQISTQKLSSSNSGKPSSASCNDISTAEIFEEIKPQDPMTDLPVLTNHVFDVSKTGHESQENSRQTLLDLAVDVAVLQYLRLHSLCHRENTLKDDLSGIVKKQKEICQILLAVNNTLNTEQENKQKVAQALLDLAVDAAVLQYVRVNSICHGQKTFKEDISSIVQKQREICHLFYELMSEL